MSGAICAIFMFFRRSGVGGCQGTPLASITTERFTSFDDAGHGTHAQGHGHCPEGDPDRDFAAMMIPHHQGAVDMARVELQFGKNPVLRRLAQGIIVEQLQEIEVMQRELRNFQPLRRSRDMRACLSALMTAIHGRYRIIR
jgi:Domain of unknown function (DUF305)